MPRVKTKYWKMDKMMSEEVLQHHDNILDNVDEKLSTHRVESRESIHTKT